MKTDTIELCSGYGQYHSQNHKTNPRKYIGITLKDISEILEDPPSVAKEKAQWVIPSTLMSRVHDDQKQKGQFEFGVADIDKTAGLTFDEIVSRTVDSLGCDVILYTSRSATEEHQKTRIILPYADPVSGTDFIILQTILNNRLESAGITPDRVTQRAAQLCYLPNKGEFYKSFQTDLLGPFDPSEWGEDIAKIQEQQEAEQEALEAQQEQSRVKASQRMASGEHDPIKAHNEAYDIPLMLSLCGYTQNGKGWLSPNSESGNPGVTISKDGQKWFSHHDSDSELGTRGNSGTWGDAFDLFVYWKHGGDYNAALKSAGEMFTTDEGVSLNKANQREHMENQAQEKAKADFDVLETIVEQPEQPEGFPPLTPDQTAINITETPVPPAALLTYYDRPVLIRGIVGSVVATGGTGKTFLLQQLAYAMADGEGLGPLRAANDKGFEVLMLCGEDPQDEVNRRLWAISKESGYFPPQLHVASTMGRLPPLMELENNNPKRSKSWDWLRETIQNHQSLDLLIIDPKSRWYGLDENSNDHATQWISCLEALAREFNLTILFSHHVSKQNGKTLDQNMSRGASAIVDGCRWVAGMTGLSDSTAKRYGIEDPRGYIEFDIVKSNYAAGLQSKFIFKRTENGTLEYAALESERRTMLYSILYDAITENPLAFNKRSFARNENGADEILDTIKNQLPKFEKKEIPAIIDAMIDGDLLNEKETETDGKGRPKTVLEVIPIDDRNFNQIRF